MGRYGMVWHSNTLRRLHNLERPDLYCLIGYVPVLFGLGRILPNLSSLNSPELSVRSYKLLHFFALSTLIIDGDLRSGGDIRVDFSVEVPAGDVNGLALKAETIRVL